MESALSLVSYEIEKNGIKIIKDYNMGLPVITGSRQHLEQVLVNLLINARDSLGGRDVREIYVQTGLRDQYVYVVVKDTGCGIEAGKLKKIFSPFYTTKIMGTGLGLSISKNIAEAHGGKIEVESEPGVGSAFSLLIPFGTDPDGQ